MPSSVTATTVRPGGRYVSASRLGPPESWARSILSGGPPITRSSSARVIPTTGRRSASARRISIGRASLGVVSTFIFPAVVSAEHGLCCSVTAPLGKV